MSFNPNDRASRHFSFAQLTATRTGISNVPDDEAILNLLALGAVLDALYEEIGTFTVDSAYRSRDVNRAVGGSDTSLHSLGSAADIIPHTMSIDEFFKRILRSPLRARLGEIILKRPQGSLHISVPTWNKCGRAMELTWDGKYRTFSESEMAPFSPDPHNPLPVSLSLLDCEQSTSELVKAGGIGTGILVLSLALSFAIYRWRKLS